MSGFLLPPANPPWLHSLTPSVLRPTVWSPSPSWLIQSLLLQPPSFTKAPSLGGQGQSGEQKGKKGGCGFIFGLLNSALNESCRCSTPTCEGRKNKQRRDGNWSQLNGFGKSSLFVLTYFFSRHSTYSFFFLRLSWAEIWLGEQGGERDAGTLFFSPKWQIRHCAPHWSRRSAHLVLDLPSDPLQCLLFALGERKFVGDRVALRHQGSLLFLRQHQGSWALQLLQQQQQKWQWSYFVWWITLQSQNFTDDL